MMAFIVYSEYNWYPHTSARLPEGTVVVATVPQTALYKPWSYVRPQILQFVTLDTANVKTSADGKKLATLYFFERRMQAQVMAIEVDCTNPQLGLDAELQQKVVAAICP